jgi:two-component system nitrogen regulation sensor histidine kinase NtrY
MVINKFFIHVLLRVMFIVVSCVVLGIALQHIDRGYYYTLAGIIFLILLQTWFLVNHVNKTNTDLEKFFSSVQDHDSSVRFQEEPKDSSFRKLHERLNHLNAIIQHVKIEHERTSHFLQSLVDHVDVGLLTFDKQGKIEIANRAAKKYFNVQQPRQLSSLKMKNAEMYKIITAVKPGHEILHKITTGDLLQSVLIKAIEFKFDNKEIKLVSFQDITHELDKKELDSWQKLIRVLTHEIMNSISPITSLTAVISGYFKVKEDKTLSGLDTIEETGKGLLGFVDKYRSLTSLPKPDLCKFTIIDLFRKCKLLMDSEVSTNIKITTRVYPEDIALVADYAQIEQALINLIKNAVAAIADKKNGIIQLIAFYNEEGTIIQIEDNGSGISKDIIEDIFVPFYTTKKNGSGIGLSLSKQIMQNHNGIISVNSTLNNGAIFTLKF